MFVVYDEVSKDDTTQTSSSESSDSSSARSSRRMNKAVKKWQIWQNLGLQLGAFPKEMAEQAPAVPNLPHPFPGERMTNLRLSQFRKGKRVWKMAQPGPNVHVHINSSFRKEADTAPSQGSLPQQEKEPFVAQVELDSRAKAELKPEEINSLIESVFSTSFQELLNLKDQNLEQISKLTVNQLLNMTLGDLLKLKAESKTNSVESSDLV